MSNYRKVLKTASKILVCGVLLILIGLWIYWKMMSLDVFLVNNSSQGHSFRLKVRSRIVGEGFVKGMTVKHLKLRDYPEGGLELSLDTNQYFVVNYVTEPYMDMDRPVSILVNDGTNAEVFPFER